MRRVVITGLGAVSPFGIGAAAFWNALLEGRSGITALTRFDPSAFTSHVASVVPPFKTTDFVPKGYRKATKIMARDIELAVVSADQAVRDAKLITKGITDGAAAVEADLLAKGWFKGDPERMGCNIGAGLVSPDMDELTRAISEVRNPDNSMSLERWGRSEDPTKTSGMEGLTPLWLLKYLPNMLACHVSIIHDTQGPSNTITCGQASAGLAVAEATRTIQRGEADIALCGGCETKVHPMAMMRWSLLNRLVEDSNANPANACRPYDESAAGTVLAEGGGVLVIEEYEHAKKRGARIYAEIVGLGASANATLNVTEPDETGESPAMAIKKALKDAQVSAGDVGLLIPPTYSIPAWDRADARAIRLAFGGDLGSLAILAARAGIGDGGAGAQALDLVAAALALHEQTIPPTANVKTPIDGLPITREKKSGPLSHAVVLATSLGGQNSALVLRKLDA